ncbi:Hypothetical protein SRAE_2000309400 [Strongyloides ratti]|uniref:Uncharacterized protein n=1 Tax=Strongyloides ratti TaxID=34506 RepID=A0A090LF94_STRRB|nr:Hypothetical protein SRAE_2000309400 [Strongyloides ratti]CEF68437.1 Hypothetical protein SRAE_2000309400 [Strongyloides ratti]
MNTREVAGQPLSQRDYESLISQLKDDCFKIMKQFRKNNFLLSKETNMVEILNLKENLLSSERDAIEMKCKIFDDTKEILEKEANKYLVNMVNCRWVIENGYQNIKSILNDQLSNAKTYDSDVTEDIKSKNRSLREDISQLEEEKKKLLEEISYHEEKWKNLDPSMTEIDVRLQVKKNVVKSNRIVRNNLAILDYKRRNTLFTNS